jgi:metallo-beta-lactamase family protein
MKIHFLGGAGTVTGSKYLIECNKHNILIDCGLFQGLKKLRELNWAYLPVSVKNIDAVILTHGHLDHVGFIPRLIKMGFRGKIYGTAPTLDIAEIILMDSAKIQEEEAEKANAEGYSKHQPAEPLYTIKEAHNSLSYFHEVEANSWKELFPDFRFRYQYVGHIIGASFVEIEAEGKKLVFSGDVGRNEDLLMNRPKCPENADYLFLESTYGNRKHPIEDVKTILKELILKTHAKGGTFIIPSFAVERTQTLMFLLWQLRAEKAIPPMRMVMDSPMGANVLKVFYEHHAWHKLSSKDFTEMCQAFEITQDFQDTLHILEDKSPKIIIAGSGMVSGGRVLTYLQSYLSEPSTSILLAGFQAEGTRGRKLLEGAEELKIYGEYYKVKASTHSLNSLSAHADQGELIEWLSKIKNKPKKVFLVHGEPHAADCLRQKIEDTYQWSCHIPDLFEIVELESTNIPT